MGLYPRRKQKYLAAKLLQIRQALDLSQNELLRHLRLEEDQSRTNISNYELDQREPPLYVLLEYARVAGVCLDVIVDDSYELPRRLPGAAVHRGINTASARRRKRRP